WIARVEDDIGDAGVLAELQAPFPGLAAVGCLVEAAIAARRPERPLRGDIDHIGVVRIDKDLAGVFRLAQTHVLPRLPAVGALINTVTEANAAKRLVLAGAQPDNVRIVRIERNAAE